MKISTKGRYALRVMIDLALHDDGNYIALKDISARQNLKIKYLEQIVTNLGKAGLIKSMRGNNGGHRLKKKPEEYRVGDILRAVEGDLAPVECLEGDDIICPALDRCPTISFWKGLDKAINDYVDSFTLKDLVGRTIKDEDLSAPIDC
ncbi:MAG: Rrf2 family transcriptional regulator [Butyrivibrio sp.]|uniref:RrF2 family transcriptional regulator n=1 Tax=Butyrivibrio sp. NC2002 TaxID=1410610 RepID=UPI00055F8AEF|nr:Rrf2 family transcriptional regulator [Butyrivibrio sp. NC2002]MBE5860059.1 Rrf2 family transcriptional regulator [Butyrivibrio sp.]